MGDLLLRGGERWGRRWLGIAAWGGPDPRPEKRPNFPKKQFIPFTQCEGFHIRSASNCKGFSGLMVKFNTKAAECANNFLPTFDARCHKSWALIT